MLLVTGANGNLGSAVINHLVRNQYSEKVTGLVRSEEKGKTVEELGADFRLGDYSDADSLKAAFDGVKRLLFISSSALNSRVRHHQNVVDAAKAKGVEHILYTSIVQADKLLSPLAEDHFETEKLIKDSGISFTIFRNTFYAEFLPLFLGNAMESGYWNFPSEGKKVNLAMRSEMAEAIAKSLFDPRQHLDKIYEITSNQAYSLQEIAETVEKKTGTKVSYNDITILEYQKQLEEAGLPKDAIMMSLGIAATFANGGLEYTFNDLEKLLGREPTDIKAFIQKNFD